MGQTSDIRSVAETCLVAFDTGRLDRMKCRVRDDEHRRFRRDIVLDVASECDQESLSWPRRAARLIRRMCEAEGRHPVIESDDRIVFERTIKKVPPIYDPATWLRLTKDRTLHELGPISNICADWGMVLSDGLEGRRQAAVKAREAVAGDADSLEFLDCATETIDAVLFLAKQYAEEARKRARNDLADMLAHVPACRPRCFHEALQALRILHSVVWMGGHYHVGLGRFDQYMWPYLKQDLDTGRLTISGAEELLAEFFISLNKDSDLYPGVQQGDNGQSLMLGGTTRDGQDAVNELTRMAIRVAHYTNMIDPKINLRITPKTDLALLMLATELTRKGLGFPQYSNDDVVIPALAEHGYELGDARDYAVAACWEFLIPGKGMEVVNIGAVSMAAAVDAGIRQGLCQGESFDQICQRIARDIREQLQQVVDSYRKLFLPPAPYYSVLVEGCLERARDLSQGLKYNNFGVHGAGSANAADALAAIRKFVFEDQSVQRQELLAALTANFEGYEPLRRKLAEDGPKVGNNDAAADALMRKLFEWFAEACEAIQDNGRGGRVRPGTGSAMYYVWLVRGKEGMREPVVGATAEGRRKGEFLGANLAPSNNAPIRGPLSVLQSFAKIPYRRVFNGGPVTMELSGGIFSDAEAVMKVGMLVRTFARLGCQQLQLNTVNLETLLDAKKHPENHKNLIVRVWGWSGYFCELAPEYQDHVIARHVYAME